MFSVTEQCMELPASFPTAHADSCFFVKAEKYLQNCTVGKEKWLNVEAAHLIGSFKNKRFCTKHEKSINLSQVFMITRQQQRSLTSKMGQARSQQGGPSACF